MTNREGGPRSNDDAQAPDDRPDAESARRRGKDDPDLEGLGSRAKSTPWRKETAHAKYTTLTNMVALRTQTEGLQAHAEGTLLNECYKRHLDAVLGFSSWKEFLAAHWPPGAGDAYERMRFAHGLTATQSSCGIKKGLRGLQIVKALNLKAFAALATVELPQANGKKIGFAEATVDQLNDALLLLADAEKTPDAKGMADVHTVRRHVRALIEKEPEYVKLKPTVSLADGEVEVRTRARGKALLLLAARFYAALARQA